MKPSRWMLATIATDIVELDELAMSDEPIDHEALIVAIRGAKCRAIERLLFAGAEPGATELTSRSELAFKSLTNDLNAFH